MTFLLTHLTLIVTGGEIIVAFHDEETEAQNKFRVSAELRLNSRTSDNKLLPL